jgi:hypothetical protein
LAGGVGAGGCVWVLVVHFVCGARRRVCVQCHQRRFHFTRNTLRHMRVGINACVCEHQGSAFVRVGLPAVRTKRDERSSSQCNAFILTSLPRARKKNHQRAEAGLVPHLHAYMRAGLMCNARRGRGAGRRTKWRKSAFACAFTLAFPQLSRANSEKEPSNTSMSHVTITHARRAGLLCSGAGKRRGAPRKK